MSVDYDRRLVVFDFMELVGRQRHPALDLAIIAAQSLPSADAYEQTLLKLICHEQVDEDSWTLLPTKMDLACFLRLLHLRLQMTSEPEKRQGLKRRISLLLEGLDAKTIEIWLAYLPELHTRVEVTAQMNLQECTVTYHSRRVSFGRKPTSFQLLHRLARSERLSLDEVAAELWQIQMDAATYDRIRILVARLNGTLSDLLGEARVLRFDHEGVRLDRVRIQIVG